MTSNPRPFAALLAAILTFAAIWPLSLPAHAQVANDRQPPVLIVVLA